MSSAGCFHRRLTFDPSIYAHEAGYNRPGPQQRATATAQRKGQSLDESGFPGPLVLPNDDLAWDPKWPAQSVRSWSREKDRNKVTAERKTLYIAAFPEIEEEIAFMNSWRTPLQDGRPCRSAYSNVSSPQAAEVVAYLAAFYHGLPVKLLPASQTPLRFTSWEDEPPTSRKKSGSSEETFIALATSTEAIRIRSRPCPDAAFSYQLNLNDLLDVVISILPADAYSLLLLVDQDMYEDEDDDYCCGRAYGGSRCAVVSMARYNPNLQEMLIRDVDRVHPWPASHCAEYVDGVIAERERLLDRQETDRQPGEGKTRKRVEAAKEAEIIDLTSSPPNPAEFENCDSPLHQALELYKATTNMSPASLWLAHICRTASHELGHCLGIDHCVYYACAMQGTASMAEDRRQPPYLCPVDLQKVKMAICGKAKDNGDEWLKERYEALLSYCERHANNHEGGLWAAFAGWLRGRLEQINAGLMIE